MANYYNSSQSAPMVLQIQDVFVCAVDDTRCQNGVSQICRDNEWVNGGNFCDVCVNGDTRCQGGVPQVCQGGQWIIGGTACDVCNDGDVQCLNDESQVCQGGQWVQGGDACGEPTPTIDPMLLVAGIGMAAVLGVAMVAAGSGGRKK
jgi:hypothetical protein